MHSHTDSLPVAIPVFCSISFTLLFEPTTTVRWSLCIGVVGSAVHVHVHACIMQDTYGSKIKPEVLMCTGDEVSIVFV